MRSFPIGYIACLQAHSCNAATATMQCEFLNEYKTCPTISDERYLSIVMNDCQKLPALPLSSVGALYLLHTLRLVVAQSMMIDAAEVLSYLTQVTKL